MTVAQPRPVTTQEAILAGALALIVPGAGGAVAAIALTLALKAGQTTIAWIMAIGVAWNLAFAITLVAVL